MNWNKIPTPQQDKQQWVHYNAASIPHPPNGKSAITNGSTTWSSFQDERLAGHKQRVTDYTIGEGFVFTRSVPSNDFEKRSLIIDGRKYLNTTTTTNKEVNMSKRKNTRDTSFSKSWQLIDTHGLEAIRELWEEHGMYGSAMRLNASPYVIRYICHKNEWVRPASKVPHLVKAVQNGRVKASHYRSLDFSNVRTNFKSSNGENNE